MNEQQKFGARVYPLSEKRLLIKQTIKSGAGYTDKYKATDPYHHERHVDMTDDKGIAQAIREALAGNLRE